VNELSGRGTMKFMIRKNGRWAPPQPVPFEAPIHGHKFEKPALTGKLDLAFPEVPFINDINFRDIIGIAIAPIDIEKTFDTSIRINKQDY